MRRMGGALAAGILVMAPTSAWAISGQCQSINNNQIATGAGNNAPGTLSGTYSIGNQSFGGEQLSSSNYSDFTQALAPGEVINFSWTRNSGTGYVQVTLQEQSGFTLRSGSTENVTAASGSGSITVGAANDVFNIAVTNYSVDAANGVTNAAEAGRNNSSVTFTISCTAPTPTLGISLTHGGTPAQGGTFPLTPTVSNTGTAATSGTITLTSTLPAGLTYSSATGTNWNCAGSSGTNVTCAFTGTIAAGASNTALSITTAVATNSALSRSVTVGVSGGGAANTPTAPDTITMLPTVTSISPTAGPVSGGTTVVITGTNLNGTTGATGVRFGATNATGYTVNSNTQITATAPANSAGTYDVTVTNGGNTSATSAADQYTYVSAPTVTAISPTTGPTSGGLTVVLTGTNFSGTTAVTFGGTAATGYTVNSTTQITATAPAGSGTVDVRVTTVGGTSATSAADQYTYIPAPTVTSISPTSGPGGGGTTVTITGTNLSGTTAVTFGGTPATGYTVNSATQITATAPAGTGTVDVRATTVGGTSATSAGDQYTYIPAPAITSVSPTAGPTGGGTTVTITGTNLSGATAVTFGASPATGFTVNSATQITATAPAGAAGTVDIRVTTPSGTSATSVADQYTYVAAPSVTSVSPIAGPTGGGTTVVITGSGFSAANPTGAVKFGAANATYTINSNTQITATSPANAAGTYDVTVTTLGGTSATSASDQYTYVSAPTVTSVSPTAGPTSGGTTVTITGTGFAVANPTGAVKFGATNATYTINSNTQITATSPANAAGTYDVTVTTAGGTSATSASDQYTYISAPTVTAVSPQGGSVTGGATVTITGTGFTSATAVTFGGTAATGFTVNSNNQITATSPAGAAGTVDIRVTNIGGTSATGAADHYTYIAPVVISPAAGALPGATTLSAYSQTFTASGGTSPYSFSSTGTLPPGLTLSAGGVLTGTPTTGGTFNFTVDVSDGSAPVAGSAFTASESYSITVGKTGQTISFTGPSTTSLSASPVAISATASSTLAVTFTSATTGVCTVAGNSVTLLTTGTCTINADQAGDAAYDAAPTVPQSFTVTPATLVITPAAASGLQVGAAYTQANPASGGVAPYSYSLGAGAFVPGTTVSASTGTVSGTPTVAGSFSYIIRVTDGQPVTADTPVTTVTIAKGNQTIAFTSTAPTATVGGAAYTVTAAASSGLGVTFTLDGASTGCALAGNTVTFNSTGTCRINANQAGDTNWNAAAQVQQSFAVGNAGAVTATVDFSPASLGAGATGTLTITLNNPNASATPAVAPLLSGSALLTHNGGSPGGSCGASGADAGANYQFNGFAIPSGSCTITLSYTGTTAGSSGGFSLGAFTPAGYPTTPATAGNALTVVPTLTSIAPNSGPVSQVVTISGTGFSTTPANNTVAFGGAGNGTVTGASATSLTVTAPAVGSGAQAVTVTVNGQTSGSATYTFIDKPVAANKSENVAYNTATAIDLTSSITGGPHSSIAIGTAVAHGTTSIAGNVVTYTPTAGYFGTDSFTYTATGAGGTSNVATVSITVATPSAPVVANKTGVAVPYNSTGTAIDLSASITGVHSSIAIGTAPTHGTTSIAGDVVTYTPTAGYYGADSFTYTATGPGGTSAPANVTLTVATPPAPTVADKSGVAVPYNGTGTAIDLSASITGVHSSIAIGTAPAHGTVTIAGNVVTYTPTAGYFGADSFTYTATGPGGTSAPATVSLTVATPAAPTAADKSGVAVPYASTGTAIDLSASITGVHSSIAIGTAPTHGTVTVAGDVVTYTPGATYYGADSFTYTATGPGGTSAPATVSLTVATPAAPTAANRTGVTVGYNSSGTAIDLSTSITGVHSTLTVSTAPTHGTTTVSGDVVTYTPTAGYFGADSFAYTVTGPGGTSAAATVSLTVDTPPPPSAGPGTSTVAGSTTTAGTSVQINLSSLVTGVYDSIQIASQPAHGTVTLSGGAGPSLTPVAAAPTSPYIATYTPAANYAGTDSFTYVAVGPGGTSAPGTVTITVVGQVPVAAPKTATAGDGQLVSVMLTEGAARGPFTGANVVSVSPANAATTNIVAAGSGSYRLDVTPNNRFGGTIVVTYTLSNVYGASAPSTVTLTVQARPDPRNDPDVAAISDAQAETARRFARAQVANFMRRTEQLHNGGGATGLAMGVTLGSRDGMAVRERPTDKGWSLAITDRMRFSGEDPAIGQFANDAQSPLSRADQLGYGRTVAATGGAAGLGGSGGVAGTSGAKQAAPGSGSVDEDGNRRVGSLATWAGGAIDIGTRDRRTDRSKITATTAGLSAGADIKLSEGVLLGLGGGYGNDLSQIGTAAQVRGTSTLYAAYASIQPVGGAFIDGMVGRGQLDFTTRRLAAAVNATARGSRDGSYSVAALSVGIDSRSGPLQWSIYGRGEYLDADLDAYVETGAGRYNLRFDAREVSSITGTIGGRLEYRQKTSFGSVTPRIRAEWNHEFADLDAQWLDYADIPGTALYGLSANSWKREQLQLSIGTRFDILSSGWSFDFETGLRAGQGEKSGTLQIRLSKRW
ncbi:IPT/TIG domain-containing protein [Sphingomonas sp. Sphisp140]|uniref:IPT/TIG domain-containing protein n=1 Tax=unclassified Sphingomonas TaxID=196159 RepID=UPI0039AEA899